MSSGSHTNGEVETETAVKGKGICFGLQMSQNIGYDPRWGVRKTSSRGDDDGTPRAFTTKQVSEGLGKKKLNISDNISTLNTWIPTNDKMYSLN